MNDPVIYMDNAATTWPKPPCVTEAITDAIIRCGGNPGRGGHRLALEAGELLFETRGLIADFFGSDDEFRVSFTQNITMAINLVLRGILKKGDDFFTWCNETLSSPPKKDYIKLKNILVSLLDESNNPIKTWIFKQAYPVKWSLSDFNAMKNEVVIESIHFKYNSFFIQQN